MLIELIQLRNHIGVSVSSDGASIFVNGREDASVSHSVAITKGKYPLFVGRDPQEKFTAFFGLMDSLYLYNTLLTPSQLASQVKNRPTYPTGFTGMPFSIITDRQR